MYFIGGDGNFAFRVERESVCVGQVATRGVGEGKNGVFSSK
jgi:hypothetical protein